MEKMDKTMGGLDEWTETVEFTRYIQFLNRTRTKWYANISDDLSVQCSLTFSPSRPSPLLLIPHPIALPPLGLPLFSSPPDPYPFVFLSFAVTFCPLIRFHPRHLPP
jgi:hypothetical protein